jgi:hypothetical protein
MATILGEWSIGAPWRRIAAERDLVSSPSGHGEGILVVDNPAFDEAGAVVASNHQPTPMNTTTSTAASLLRGTRGLRNLPNAPLSRFARFPTRSGQHCCPVEEVHFAGRKRFAKRRTTASYRHGREPASVRSIRSRQAGVARSHSRILFGRQLRVGGATAIRRQQAE